MSVTAWVGMLVLFIFVSVLGGREAPQIRNNDRLSEATLSTTSQECKQAGERALGPQAKILRCGDLSGANALEALAILSLSTKTPAKEEYYVKRATILRREAETWRVVLDASENYIQNPGGYIGVSCLPAPRLRNFKGYWLRILAHRTDGSGGFTLEICDLGKDLMPEVGTDALISWNPAERKYQEYAGSSANQYVPVREIRTPPSCPHPQAVGPYPD